MLEQDFKFSVYDHTSQCVVGGYVENIDNDNDDGSDDDHHDHNNKEEDKGKAPPKRNKRSAVVGWFDGRLPLQSLKVNAGCKW